MVLGNRVAFSIGNGAEFGPIEMGRKSPDRFSHNNYNIIGIFHLSGVVLLES